MPTLYFSRNPNPRLAVATARHLGSQLDFVWASPFDPAQSERFRKLNPSLRIPILLEGETSLWEADAIACRLSMLAGSTFWRLDSDLPDLIRWISWAKANFEFACNIIHFEYGTKQRYALGPVDPAKVAEGEELFRESAGQLEAHLENRDFLLDSGLSYADFRMATFLPFNDAAGLPLADYPSISRWHERLSEIPAWADPFDGLAAPDLPSVPPRAR